MSEKLPIGDTGTIQGSVLGGLLFLIYSNDLPAEKENDSTDFVDDHADICMGDSINDVQNRLQNEANNTSEWLRINGMAISSEKTKVMVMKTDSPPNITIEIEGDLITPTISERYLGIYLSSNMSWQHYLYGENWRNSDNFPGLISILNSRIGMLNKIKKFASKEKMLIMIDGIILSNSDIIWESLGTFG